MPSYPRLFSIPDKDLPRLWSKVPPADGDDCRNWRGAPVAGYGQFSFISDGKLWRVRAHNAVWVATHGLFLPLLQPDHLCFNTMCVNTDHIEWVTHEENQRRRRWLNTGYCKSGRHRWDEQEPYLTPNGGKVCRPCLEEYTEAHWSEQYKARREMRGDVAFQPSNKDKTRCVNGHEFTEENTYYRVNGGRACRACVTAATRAWRAKMRAKV